RRLRQRQQDRDLGEYEVARIAFVYNRPADGDDRLHAQTDWLDVRNLAADVSESTCRIRRIVVLDLSLVWTNRGRVNWPVKKDAETRQRGSPIGSGACRQWIGGTTLPYRSLIALQDARPRSNGDACSENSCVVFRVGIEDEVGVAGPERIDVAAPDGQPLPIAEAGSARDGNVGWYWFDGARLIRDGVDRSIAGIQVHLGR